MVRQSDKFYKERKIVMLVSISDEEFISHSVTSYY